MQDQPKAERATLFDRNKLVEGQFNLDRIGLGGQPQTEGQSTDVGVDGKARQVERHAAHNVCRLPADAGKGHEILSAARYLTAEPADDLLGHPDQIARLGPKEPGRMDDLLDLERISSAQRYGVGKSRE